jgi:hypothetical protein
LGRDRDALGLEFANSAQETAGFVEPKMSAGEDGIKIDYERTLRDEGCETGKRDRVRK